MRRARDIVFGGIVAIAAFACPAYAKTVALWPLELNPDTGAFDGRCAVNPDLSMSLGSDGTAGIAQGVGWNLPPNPDPAENTMFPPVNRTAVKGWRNTAGWTLRCTSAELQKHLWNTDEFTVEGWIKFDPNPASGWFIIMQGGNGSDGGKGGWFLSWRGTEGARQFHLCVAKYDNAGGCDMNIGPVLSQEMEASLTNSWHHLALTHKGTAWKVYIDGGDPIAEATVAEPADHAAASFSGLYFGGRPNNNTTANRLNASFDYWRVSDKALDPSEFLCAGGEGTLVPEPVDAATDTTVAYWRLDRKADGSLDTWDYVGTANLHGGFMPTQTGGQIATNAASVLAPDAECAFAGNPPNPTASLGGVGNAGSLLARHHDSEYAVLKVPSLGAELEPATGSFTVEAYLKPRRRESPPLSQFVFNTCGSDNGNGWCLQLLGSGSDWGFVVMAKDEVGYIPYNEPVSGSLTDWDGWKHVALVYESGAGAAGFGQWRCYIDGELSGSYDYPRAWSGTTKSKTFYIGGRDNSPNNFCGWIDCMRVSKAALAPSQFLCAANGTAASDVLAYWPLNFTNGSFDGRDVAGSYLLQSVHEVRYSPVAAEGAPTVTNPDRSANFDGNAAAALSGSALFRGQNNERPGCSLETDDATIANLLGNGEFTFECWFNRHTVQSGNSWESIFMTAGDVKRFGEWFQPYLRFAYNETTGFQIEDRMHGSEVVYFAGTGGQPLNTWRHLALTRAIVDGNSMYKLYLDGVEEGATPALTKPYSTKSISLFIGGRPNDSANSWRGQFSSIRISRGVLPPSRFLCAEPEVAEPAVEPRTIVYWPFDNADGAADTAPAFGPEGFDLRKRTENGASGAADMAAPYVPLETAEFMRANAGSVILAENAYMRSIYLGDYLSSSDAFTVEGWLKWDGATRGGEVTVCGQYDSTSDSSGGRIGWKLIIDDTGDEPLFGIYARSGYMYTPMAKGLFESRPVRPGSWQHVALAYDPKAGTRGIWKLYVNGREAGAVENTWYDATKPAANSYFKFGRMNDVSATGFSGGLDMWRISTGTLGPDRLLFQRNTGFMFTVK